MNDWTFGDEHSIPDHTSTLFQIYDVGHRGTKLPNNMDQNAYTLTLIPLMIDTHDPGHPIFSVDLDIYQFKQIVSIFSIGIFALLSCEESKIPNDLLK